MLLLQLVVLLDNRRDIGITLLLLLLLLMVFPVLVLFMELCSIHIRRDRTFHSFQLSCKDIRVKNGGEMGLVVLLVIGKPHPLPLRLVDLYRLLLFVADSGYKKYLVVLGLEGIDLADKV